MKRKNVRKKEGEREMICTDNDLSSSDACSADGILGVSCVELIAEMCEDACTRHTLHHEAKKKHDVMERTDEREKGQRGAEGCEREQKREQKRERKRAARNIFACHHACNGVLPGDVQWRSLLH